VEGAVVARLLQRGWRIVLRDLGSSDVARVSSRLSRFLLLCLQSRLIDEMSIKELGSPRLNRGMVKTAQEKPM
jgi:hypothetical protein